MPSHPWTIFEIQKYYQNEHKFNGVYSRNNAPKIKHGAYVIKLDENELIVTHWTALSVNGIALQLHKFQKKLKNWLETKI